MLSQDYPSPNDLCKLAGFPARSRVLSAINLSSEKLTAHRVEPGYTCLFNWSSMSYCFISDSVKNVLGFEPVLFMNKGLSFMLDLIQHRDRIKLNDIYKRIFDFYYSTPLLLRLKLRFSYNFRIRTSDNTWLNILSQSFVTELTPEGRPLMEYINYTDITHCHTNEVIRLAIHRISDSGAYIHCYEYVFPDIDSILSQRENQIVNLAAQGYTSKAIASKLNLSIETVKNHRKNILVKTGAANITEVVSKVYRK